MASNTNGGRRSQIANYILIIAAIVLLLSYPFQDFFAGGLLTHLAGAALIGGLADWYAVTALFRRPLGISFKTALIPNSKERIAEMARHMIESEILTVSNMYNVLKRHPILGATLDYLHTEKGFQSAERIFGQILNTFLYTVDMKTVVKAFAGIGGSAVEKIDLAPVMSKAIQASLRGESGKDFLDFMIFALEQVVKSDTTKGYIGEIYEASLRQYAKHNILLGWAIKAAIKMEVFQPSHVAGLLQEKCLALLEETKEENSLQRQQALHYLWKQAEHIEINEEWSQRIDAYKDKMYDHLMLRPDTEEAWQRYVQNPDNQKRFCTAAAEFVVQKLEGWHQNPEQVEQINRQALAFAARELKRLQVWFGKTAEAEILKYDGTYLAEQLENSVWYDLQMIRVNGSLVGAVLGAVIYLAMYAMKGGAIL